MIEGRFGNFLIANEQYHNIASMDFTEYRQCQKYGQQELERSKQLFGVSDPIDFVNVQIQPPVFKGNQQNIQINQQKFERNNINDIKNYQIVSVVDLEKIKQKSFSVKNKNSIEQYHDNNKVQIQMADSICDIDEKQHSQGINLVYDFNMINQTNF